MKRKAAKKSDFARRLRDAGLTNRLHRRVTMKMELDELEGYVETVEHAFKEQLEREEREPKQPPAGLSEEELEAFYHGQSNIYYSLDHAFPSLVRQTAFIHLYSILERELISLCHCAYEHGGLPESHAANQKDKGIVEAQVYLKKIAGVPFPDQRERVGRNLPHERTAEPVHPRRPHQGYSREAACVRRKK